MSRGATAEIDLGAIKHNLSVAGKLTGGLPVIAVVKADAYGHGAVEVSRALERNGVSMLATAFISEAVELRDAGIRTPILVLFNGGSLPPAVTGARSLALKGGMDPYFRYNLVPVISDIKTAEAFSKEARKRAVELDIHLKIDTGMGRMGLYGKNGRDLIQKTLKVAGLENLNVTGLMSHFSEADLSDITYAKIQLKRFDEVKKALERFIKGGRRPPLCHIANSAAIISFKESHLDAVRPGLMLYGCSPVQWPTSGLLKPAMKVKTRILFLRRLKKGQPVSYGRTFITVRESLVAVLPVGYADGYSRAFSNNADVLVRGRRAPVIGRVCMDLTMADVTDVKGAREGDEAVLLGEGSVGAWDLARRASTIPYEIMTSLGGRSMRIYK